MTEVIEAVTVLVADADEPTRVGLRRDLEQHGFTVIAEAGDAEQAVDAALRHRPTVALLDAEIPGGGIEATDRIAAGAPDTRIAVLVPSLGEREFFDVIGAGADGYLLKTPEPGGLSSAVDALSRGEAAIPRALTGLLLRDFRRYRRPLAAEPPERSSVVRYVPRLVRHYRRRRRSGMPIGEAWTSAHRRMRDYA